jgi:hypothetical protein
MYRRLVLLLAIGLAACQGPAGPTAAGRAPTPQPKERATREPAAPAGSLEPGAAATASPAPLALSTSPAAAASSAPSGEPAGAAPAALDGRKRLSDRLLAIAQLGFTQRRSEMLDEAIAKQVALGRVGIISDRSGGLVSDRTGGLIGNNSGGILGNNAGGLIGNNSGSLITDRGGGYQLQQARGEPGGSIATGLLPDEALKADRLFMDGVRQASFGKPNAARYLRTLTYDKEGGLDELRSDWDTARNNYLSYSSYQDKDARLLSFYGLIGDFAKGGSGDWSIERFRIVKAPVAFVREPATGTAMEVRRYYLSFPQRYGEFEIHFENFGVVETGTLSNVTSYARLHDPLLDTGGESVVRRLDGTIVHRKRVIRDGTRVVREYDMQDGLAVSLTQQDGGDGPARWEGVASVDGREVAKVALRTGVNGSSLFTLRFEDEPDKPYEFGYGALQDAAPGATPVPVEPPARLATVAGRDLSGYGDGDGLASAFSSLNAIVPSGRDPSLYYVADSGNNRLRTLRFDASGGVRVGTLAGNGQPVSRDGVLSEAGFLAPRGLAVVPGEGGGEHLYVADSDGHRIRRVTLAADGTGRVDTLAGDGTEGSRNGPGLQARFGMPYGLAHDPSTRRLYVSDATFCQVRAIDLADPTHPVSTLAGSGLAASRVDGPALEATFNMPSKLVLDPERRLHVMDVGSRAIRRIDMTRSPLVVETELGLPDAGEARIDGPPASATLSPSTLGFAAGPGGKLLLGSGDDIRVWDPARQVLRSLVAFGEPGSADGPVRTASVQNVTALQPMPDGSLLVGQFSLVRRVRGPAAAVYGP